MKKYTITLTTHIPDVWHDELPKGAWPVKIWDDVEFFLNENKNQLGYPLEIERVVIDESSLTPV